MYGVFFVCSANYLPSAPSILDFGIGVFVARGQNVLIFVEPPDADPHVRWCGEGVGKPASLPDFVPHVAGGDAIKRTVRLQFIEPEV